MSDINRQELDRWLSSIKLEYASRQVGPKILRFLVRWDTMYEVTFGDDLLYRGLFFAQAKRIYDEILSRHGV